MLVRGEGCPVMLYDGAGNIDLALEIEQVLLNRAQRCPVHDGVRLRQEGLSTKEAGRDLQHLIGMQRRAESTELKDGNGRHLWKGSTCPVERILMLALRLRQVLLKRFDGDAGKEPNAVHTIHHPSHQQLRETLGFRARGFRAYRV